MRRCIGKVQYGKVIVYRQGNGAYVIEAGHCNRNTDVAGNGIRNGGSGGIRGVLGESLLDTMRQNETGKNKGLNRIEVGTLETIPLASTFRNFRTPDEQLKFFSNNPPVMVSAINSITE